MVAVAQFIPADPDQKASVLAVLREHPEMAAMIVRASEKTGDIFAKYRITLDTRQYDDWDPPVRMLVWVDEPWEAFKADVERFTHWLAHDASHDRKLLFIMPMWDGPLETAP